MTNTPTVIFSKFFTQADYSFIIKKAYKKSHHLFFTLVYDEATPIATIKNLTDNLPMNNINMYIWDCFNVEHIKRPGRKSKRGRKPFIVDKPNPASRHLHGLIYCDNKDYKSIMKHLGSYNTIRNLTKSDYTDIFDFNKLLLYLHNGHHIIYKNFYYN